MFWILKSCLIAFVLIKRESTMWPWRVTITEHSEGQPCWIWIWVASRHLNSTGFKKSQRNDELWYRRMKNFAWRSKSCILDWIGLQGCFVGTASCQWLFSLITQPRWERWLRLLGGLCHRVQSQQTVCQLRSGVAGSLSMNWFTGWRVT